MRALCVISLVMITACSFAQKEFVGTYEVVMYRNGSPVPNSSLPVGQVMLLKLEKGGKWLMHNMLSGWEGTWTPRKGRVEMVTLTGPAGKLKQSHTDLLEVSRDKTVLILKESGARVLEFRRDDQFEKKLAKRYQEVSKKLGPP